MTTRLLRVVVAGLALVGLTGVPLGAQTAEKPPAPSVTPLVQPRFERPSPEGAVRTRSGGFEADGAVQTFFVRTRPVVRIGQPYVLKAGDVAYDVRAVMANVRIEGRVEGDVVAVLGDVTLTETAVIDGTLVVVGGSVMAAPGARVGRDLVLVGGGLDAAADFAAQGEHVVIGTAAVGEALRAFVPWVTRGLLWGRIIVPDLRWIWAIVGVVFLLGLILNLLFNKPVAACADTLARRPLSAFLMGLLTMMLMPVFVVLLVATVIGVVAVPFAIAAFIVAVIVGRISVVRAVGRVIVRESDADSRFQASRSFVIGFAILVIALMVPIVGLLTWLFVGSFGLGSASLTFFSSFRRERPPAAPKGGAPGVSPDTPPAPEPAPPPAPLYQAEPAVHATAAASFAAEPVRFEPAAGPPPAGAAAFTPPSPGGATAFGRDLTLYPRATLLDRLAAVALDFVLVGVVTALFDFDRYDSRGPGPFFLLLFVYHVAFWAWKGTTLGGIVCSLRVVRTTSAPLRFADALVRGLTSIFSAVALGIGFFWMLNDPERQTWHDKIAGTVVVKLPRELVLE